MKKELDKYKKAKKLYKKWDDAVKETNKTTRERLRKNKTKDFIKKPDWLLDPKGYLDEIIKDGICSSMNSCQCLGTAGGCPGKPGWMPDDIFKEEEIDNESECKK